MNLRDQLKSDLKVALVKLKFEYGEVELSRTGNYKLGDYTSNIALKIAKKNKQSAVDIAIKITDSVGSLPHIKKLEVKEPGFINFFVKDELWQEQVKEVLKQGAVYGSSVLGKGKKARVEFVSANPTGPLHFGNARGGPIGDVLASVLSFSGYEVLREYYHNDLGGQVDKLGESVVSVYGGGKLEDQEYKGEYLRELAAELKNLKVNMQDVRAVGKAAVDILLKEALADSKSMGIDFDQIYPESEFIESGQTKAVLDKLDSKGFLRGKDGATWFAPNDQFLEDRETVVVKSDGDYTYFANDIAYHDLKFKDDPDLVIDVFGANHHGHVPRLQAAISSLGYDVSRFHVILYQWVRFKKGKELLKMSKRSGTFVTAKEVLDDIGSDALRFFILMHDANGPIDFDLDLAKEKSSKNPVYYVQYANARISSILAKSDKQKATRETNYALLSTEYELNLIKQISKLPELVKDVASSFAVHHLAGYAIDLADSFHKFYENCRVIGEKEDLKTARIALVLATQLALQNTLKLLGVSAPEKM